MALSIMMRSVVGAGAILLAVLAAMRRSDIPTWMVQALPNSSGQIVSVFAGYLSSKQRL
ncbi:MAG: hypothetical protein HC935_05230 [Pseudanabaena sp. SU_2_4]|nr:hypothetical protein [Pseudanabaena sp. SU_2_4]